MGAKRELVELQRFVTTSYFHDEVTDHTTSRGIKWHNIPPGGPHFGGLWEAGLKRVKWHLRRIAGSIPLTFEE